MPAFSTFPRESSFANAFPRFPKIFSEVEGLPPCDTEKPSTDDRTIINVKMNTVKVDREGTMLMWVVLKDDLML
jgi:hypothetical protein